MTPAEHVDQLKINTAFAAKRVALAERLRALDDQIGREIAFNSNGPSIAGSQDIFRALDTARALVRSTLVCIATETLFPD